MNINERLKILIISLGLNLKEFSEKTGVPYPTLQHYLSGRSEPGAENLQKIAIQFDVNLNWLLTGEGEMFRQPEEGKERKCSIIDKEKDFTIWAIVELLKDMDEEKRQEILKHIEKEKLLLELLEERKRKKGL